MCIRDRSWRLIVHDFRHWWLNWYLKYCWTYIRRAIFDVRVVASEHFSVRQWQTTIEHIHGRCIHNRLWDWGGGAPFLDNSHTVNMFTDVQVQSLCNNLGLCPGPDSRTSTIIHSDPCWCSRGLHIHVYVTRTSCGSLGGADISSTSVTKWVQEFLVDTQDGTLKFFGWSKRGKRRSLPNE